MTLLSLLAILASVVASFGAGVNHYLYWNWETKNTPTWKRILWKSLRWFVVDEAPRQRGILLKLLFSMLILTALGCGFWDIYTLSEDGGVFVTLAGILFSIASLILLWIAISFAPGCFKELISTDYFRIKEQKWVIPINIAILCIWIVVFIASVYMEDRGRIFALISISAGITVIISFFLTVLGAICYILGKMFFFLIITPLLYWIRWLRE